jgi:protein-disulfide isomerase
MSEPYSCTLSSPVNPQDHYQGSEFATVILVLYGDYQCSDSKTVYEVIQRLSFFDSLKFVFRHFPQVDRYPDALHAAEAAEAAGSQDQFWQMHQCLFEHQDALDDGSLVEYAIALDLSVNQFLAEMTSDAHVPHIMKDIDSGIQSGVACAPAVFINGERYEDLLSLDTLSAKIASLI